MTRVVLSLGANLGDPVDQLARAVGSLGTAVRAVSGVWITPPWGGVPQPDFHNIVVIAEGPWSAAEWLAIAQRLEQEAARVRDIRWGPRTLDVDLIVVGGEVSVDPVLTLPHPRAAERSFVLVPWLEIDPEAELPGRGPVRDLPAAVPEPGMRRSAAPLPAHPGADVPTQPVPGSEEDPR